MPANQVSIPNGLPRPFRHTMQHLMMTAGMFQSLTGFPGHSDLRWMNGYGHVSIPNGLPRPFRQAGMISVVDQVSIPNGLPRPFRPIK